MFTVNEYNWTRPRQETLPGGTQRHYRHDPLMRIKQITTTDPGDNPQLNYTYSYDMMDNIIAKRTEHGDYAYDYDELYRLTITENPDQPDEAFGYDAVGNRLSSADTATTWRYNANNELQGYNGVSFVYDANGNMIEKNDNGVITRLFYNLEDRLERVEDASGNITARYYYDPFGRRLYKEVAGTRTYFHYNDEGLIGEYDAAGTQLKAYGWKPGSTWSTDPLFMKVGSQYYWYHNDHLGTPQKMTSSSGAVVWEARYTSFGMATVDQGAVVVNPLRFAGQYYDSETGLHNWNRYYDPKIGRYMRADPAGINGGINLYSYANGSPLRYTDYEGLACKQSSPWEPITVLTNSISNATLISSVINKKWKLVRVWDVVPMAYGKQNSSINCACEWKPIGCTKKSVYEKPIPHKAIFKCDDGDCREWKETRYKDINKYFDVEEDIPCLFSGTPKITFGVPSGQGCDCQNRPPQ